MLGMVAGKSTHQVVTYPYGPIDALKVAKFMDSITSQSCVNLQFGFSLTASTAS